MRWAITSRRSATAATRPCWTATILVHGYVTVEGRKIGKSAGNAIDPVPLAAELGADALRYYLLRHIRSTDDGDFS
jgi:methionyl-tRNA synthetase